MLQLTLKKYTVLKEPCVACIYHTHMYDVLITLMAYWLFVEVQT